MHLQCLAIVCSHSIYHSIIVSTSAQRLLHLIFHMPPSPFSFFFFFNDPAPPELSTLPLPAALPIGPVSPRALTAQAPGAILGPTGGTAMPRACVALLALLLLAACGPSAASAPPPAPPATASSRSEEHTSELQSQSNLVCRLLLEKKK